MGKEYIGLSGNIYQENVKTGKSEGRPKVEIQCTRICDECPISSCSLHPSFHLFIQAYMRDMALEIKRR